MAPVRFTVTHQFTQAPQVVWSEMVDWPSHGEWIPATRVEIDEGDPQAVGGMFTGYTGYGPLMLVDHMRISEIDFDTESGHGRCVVDKLGPVLKGTAGFTIEPSGSGTELEWFEDVTVPYLPGFLAPVVNKMSALGFAQGMRKLAKKMDGAEQTTADSPTVT
ncbi:MAG: SRPBCC family protein [Actinomycetota bacterium]